ncbi:hypothetical protein UVI_02019000 [Ustilaginoidea virens]|uniref:Uncharacterized protein n=1 Tax=Ustilaginoidea virens TaxID=1159556 RepID=A0A1B5KYF0_USTVR|nr:hypothetical protein UVI_02019000 [Ustilaginoidea virens]
MFLPTRCGRVGGELPRRDGSCDEEESGGQVDFCWQQFDVFPKSFSGGPSGGAAVEKGGNWLAGWLAGHGPQTTEHGPRTTGRGLLINVSSSGQARATRPAAKQCDQPAWSDQPWLRSFFGSRLSWCGGGGGGAAAASGGGGGSGGGKWQRCYCYHHDIRHLRVGVNVNCHGLWGAPRVHLLAGALALIDQQDDDDDDDGMDG